MGKLGKAGDVGHNISAPSNADVALRALSTTINTSKYVLYTKKGWEMVVMDVGGEFFKNPKEPCSTSKTFTISRTREVASHRLKADISTTRPPFQNSKSKPTM
ncbi:hypothetical protein BOTNAR_0265g00040 [Botryotinia narcissicola]|uniref:Uncharacterized protein n=1 Tax=Botryotinia narcissicola TaxID=278944 RepID=A0A4Z1I4X3_9HELO|nr:hypothetical protein BOTNAR_0265g00040 [Botryotinia narcissicola]